MSYFVALLYWLLSLAGAPGELCTDGIDGVRHTCSHAAATPASLPPPTTGAYNRELMLGTGISNGL